MVNPTDYLTAWGIYLAAAAVALLLWWRITRRWRGGLGGHLLRALIAALLLAPVQHPSHETWLVPAWVVASLGAIADGAETAVLGIAGLSVAAVLGLTAGVLSWWLARRRRERALSSPE